MTPDALDQFFESGRHHVDYVSSGRVGASILSLHRGGRSTSAAASGASYCPWPTVEQVVGIDVSPAMLAEAQKNCAERGISNVALVPSDDDLSAVEGTFDLIHSCLVFQHVDVPRGRRLFELLLDRLAPDGVGAIHVTFGKSHLATTWGQVLSVPGTERSFEAPEPPPDLDPEMQMNPYNLSELAFLMQRAGVRQFHSHFTDHGGELGVFSVLHEAGCLRFTLIASTAPHRHRPRRDPHAGDRTRYRCRLETNRRSEPFWGVLSEDGYRQEAMDDGGRLRSSCEPARSTSATCSGS
jgi:SAM-dependent methyltransferase